MNSIEQRIYYVRTVGATFNKCALLFFLSAATGCDLMFCWNYETTLGKWQKINDDVQYLDQQMEVVHIYNKFGLVVVIVADHRRKEMYKHFLNLPSRTTRKKKEPLMHELLNFLYWYGGCCSWSLRLQLQSVEQLVERIKNMVDGNLI